MAEAEKGHVISNKSYWKNPVVVVISTLLLFFSAQIIGAVFASPIVSKIENQNYQILAVIAINFLATIGIISIAKSAIGFSWENLGLKNTTARSAFQVLPAFVIYFFFSAIFTLLAAKYIPGFNVEQTQDIGFSDVVPNLELVATFISLLVITPIVEEIIFRGILFNGLRRRLGFMPSAVIASIVFAAAHLQWNVSVDTFALSLVLCFLVEKSKSIYPAIALHALKNSLAFVLLYIVPHIDIL